MAIKKRSVLERLRYWCCVTLQKIFWLHCVISTARLTSEVKGNALDYYRVPTKEVVTAVEKASNGWRMDVSSLKYVWHNCDISLLTLQKIFWLHCAISTARLTSEVKGNALDYYRVPTKEVVTAVEKASNGWRMDVSPLKYVWHHCDISLSCSKFKSRVEMHHLSAVKYGMQSFLPAVAKVIIEKSSGEVSLMEKDTIENVS